MEKAEHSRRPVFEEDDPFSCTKKLKFDGSPLFEDTGYTLFIDSGYKLPLYLSEFALSEFNSNKKTVYEKVSVVKTMKSLDVVKGTTYLITFKASLPDNKSNYAQTFETNTFMSPLDPTAKIEIMFVRIKPSEFDDNGKEDSDEKVSEADEIFFDEKLSQSNKKDNEEKLSEFDEKDTEKIPSISDEKGNEEKRCECSEKHTEEKLSEFIGKDSAEEKIIEYDEKDSEFDKDAAEEKIVESDEKDIKENLNEFDSDSDDEYKKGPEYSKEMKQYRMEVEKSDGFEIGYYPHLKGSSCMYHRYYDPPATILPTTCLNQLVYFSQLAICVYNMKEVTYYDNVRVMKAMTSGTNYMNYYITFVASLSDGNAVTFQTRLLVTLPFPYHEIEIEFVRIKPSNNPDITN